MSQWREVATSWCRSGGTFGPVPELVEVEAYRRLAERVLGRRVAEVFAPDSWYLKRGLDARTVTAAIEGVTFGSARRVGKLLMLDPALTTDPAPAPDLSRATDPSSATGPAPAADGGPPGPVLGLRFGMSGRLIVDGVAGVDHLLHSGTRQVEVWDRFVLRFADGGDLRMRDPRRLGGVELDPAESDLGPDAMSVTPAGLGRALAASRAPLKARLLDQSRIAGIGNLAADEILWRAGIDPARPASSLTPAELRRLHRHLRTTMADLMDRGGSHLGDLMNSRHRGGACPRDGAELERRTVGGRTTFSCPRHQR